MKILAFLFWPFWVSLVRPICENGAKKSRSLWQKCPQTPENNPQDCEPQVRQLVTFFAEFRARENLELFVFAVLGLDRFMRSGPKLSPFSKQISKIDDSKTKKTRLL